MATPTPASTPENIGQERITIKKDQDYETPAPYDASTKEYAKRNTKEMEGDYWWIQEEGVPPPMDLPAPFVKLLTKPKPKTKMEEMEARIEKVEKQQQEQDTLTLSDGAVVTSPREILKLLTEEKRKSKIGLKEKLEEMETRLKTLEDAECSLAKIKEMDEKIEKLNREFIALDKYITLIKQKFEECWHWVWGCPTRTYESNHNLCLELEQERREKIADWQTQPENKQ
jgi:hypothetical protein